MHTRQQNYGTALLVLGILMTAEVAGAAEERGGQRIYVTGILREHVGADKTAPFALADSRGRIRYIVSAEKGVPLDRYIHGRVGIRGRVHYGEYAHLIVDEIDLDASDNPRNPRATKTTSRKPARRTPAELAQSSIEDENITSKKPARRERAKLAQSSFDDEKTTPKKPARRALAKLAQTSFDDEIEAPPSIGRVVQTGGCDCGAGDCGGGISCDSEYGASIDLGAEYGGSCAECGGGCSGPTCSAGPTIWVRGEYLYWWGDGMNTPPLVKTADAVEDLPLPTGQILFGNEQILDEGRSGDRIRFGGWLDGCRSVGLEGEYLSLENASTRFVASSDANGNPIRGRPFFAINPRDAAFMQIPAREAAELVSAPGLLSGTVSVDADSEFDSAGFRVRINLCACLRCGSDPCGCPRSSGSRIDLLLGYRHTGLDESLVIREDLTSLETANPGNFDILDRFDTQNEFHGGEVGVLWNMKHGCWSLELLGKLGLGNNEQRVTIDGQTTITGSPIDDGTFTGGLLAQTSNIGEYQRDDFAVIPELGVTLGYQLTCSLRMVLGYSFIYWSRVTRPGDQIDLDVNEDFLPPPFEPFGGPLRPEFVFRDTDFWVQGINVGLDFQW